MKKVLIQRLALIIAVVYLLSPFQQQISSVLHSLSHDLSLPDYVMTHSRENPQSHQYGDHRTNKINHEHQFIDFVQSLLEDSGDNEQQPDPYTPAKSVDKHLVQYTYTLVDEIYFEQKNIAMPAEQNIRNGHSHLWQEPPIDILL